MGNHMAQKVAILYGWSEGKWHSKQLVKELEDRGFKLVKNVEKADIIIAHSLGTLLIPEKITAKFIMLVGIPYWPGQPIIKSFKENLKYEASRKYGLSWWLRRSGWATYYVLKKLGGHYRTLRRRAKNDLGLPAPSKDRRIILIRNQLDTFMHPDIQELLPVTKNYTLIKLPGGHEDWMLRPKKYIEILLKHL
jgi:hypothetical protein